MKILLVVLLVALVIYGSVRLLERRSARRNATPKPVAPDDDLEFLRNLEWQQRKDRHRRRKDQDGAGDADTAGDGSEDAEAENSRDDAPDAEPDPETDREPDREPDRDGDEPRP